MSQEELPNLENETTASNEAVSDPNPIPQNTESEEEPDVEAEDEVEAEAETANADAAVVEETTEAEVEAQAEVTAEAVDPVTAVVEESAGVEVEVKPEVEPVAGDKEQPDVTASNEDEDDADTEDDSADDDDANEGDDENSDNEIDHSLDLESLDKDQLLALAIGSTQKHTPRDAFNRLKQIRPIFNDLLRSEKKIALQHHIEAGNEAESFEYSDETYRERFKEVFNLGKNARMEERQRIEDEKVKNYNIKEALLEQLRTITDSDETEKSLEDVKVLQHEWRAIRVLPADKVQGLWDSYHFLLDKFYDNHSINIELKELDRKKNLEVKIELTKKVDALSTENSLKKSFILLNKYQEEFRNTGPVPREFNKEIWERFREATDKVYAQKKAVFDSLEDERTKNLELKQVLVEKASLIAETSPKKLKEWNEKAAGLDALMEEWKGIGQVPRAKNDEVWKAFRASFNTFYDNKSAFFKQINNERKANLIIKEDICKRAEEVSSSEDLNFATNELKKLQSEWKEVGPVPDKVSGPIWKRFRTACDSFFERKQKSFAGRKDEEVKNLSDKESLITKLHELKASGNADSILHELKTIQTDWSAIGFVPIKKKKDLDARYRKASDEVYNQFKLDRQSHKQGSIKEHYSNLSHTPAGGQRLQDEEFKIKKKLTFLTGEISTLENNMEFFGRSAGAQKLKHEISDKIDKMKEQMTRLKTELKVLKSVKEAPTESNEEQA